MFVSPILTGGLGNRLFQVATALSYAKKHNKQLIFINSLASETGHGEHDTIYKLFPHIEVKEELLLPLHTIYEIPTTHYIYKELDYVEGSVIIHGYRQSWKYFSDIKILPNFGNILKSSNNTWSIHFRFGDFDILPHHQINRRRYYSEAIKRVPVGVKLLIFSDELEKCKEYIEYLDFLKIQYTLCNVGEVEALYMMSKCSGSIVSNSTFSWWGSYLAHQENSSHIGIYPNSNGIGLPFPTDYIPSWGTIMTAV